MVTKTRFRNVQDYTFWLLILLQRGRLCHWTHHLLLGVIFTQGHRILLSVELRNPLFHVSDMHKTDYESIKHTLFTENTADFIFGKSLPILAV